MNADLQSQIDHYNALLSDDAPAHVYAKLTEVYRKAGKIADATHTAKIGLERHPGSLTIQESLGLCYLDKGEAESAVRVLAPVVERLPENAVAAVSLAVALSRIDRVPDALNVLKRRLEKDPLDRAALNLLRALESKSVPTDVLSTPPAESTAPAVPTAVPAAPALEAQEPEPVAEYELPIPDAPVRPEMEYVVRPVSELFRDMAFGEGEAALSLDGFFDDNPRPLAPRESAVESDTAVLMKPLRADDETTQAAPEAAPETAADDDAAPPVKIGFFKRVWRALTGKRD